MAASWTAEGSLVSLRRGGGAVRRSRVTRRRGMTLIEVIVVVIIGALAVTGVTYGISSITRANLRSGAMTFAAASRFAYGRAISQNATVRLKLDFESSQMSFEEAHGNVTLARVGDATREDLEEQDGEDGAAVDPWEAARARLEDTLNPSFGASPFSAIPGRRYEARPLADGVRIVRLFVPHEPEPRETGTGAVYFFPGGQTEHAVLWLGDSDDRIYSVEIHPLTGRAQVYDYAYEPEELLDDGQGRTRSEVRD
ncbi:MAG: prepilin-type N-terminal cleavage/methylation domain-containing protein [Myxococcota bacterium]|nr:prepilin-type N-terminal cleavage/methylation domain-containing protein [Myxococcota bacterium]